MRVSYARVDIARHRGLFFDEKGIPTGLIGVPGRLTRLKGVEILAWVIESKSWKLYGKDEIGSYPFQPFRKRVKLLHNIYIALVAFGAVFKKESREKDRPEFARILEEKLSIKEVEDALLKSFLKLRPKHSLKYTGKLGARSSMLIRLINEKWQRKKSK